MVNCKLCFEKIHFNKNKFEIMKKGTLYNDGLRFDRVSDSEAFSLKGFCDINNNIYFEDAKISYFNYF